MRGGYRENSGRKKGFSGIKAEKSREYIIQQVENSLKPIVTGLVDRARQGDLRATQILFDRAFGRPIIPIETTEVPPKMILIDE